MKRMMSTFALSAWAGFYLLCGLWHGALALGSPGAAEVAERWPLLRAGLPDFEALPDLPVRIAAASALASLAAAALFLAAIVHVHGTRATDASKGERLALAGLLLAAVTALGARLAGIAIDPIHFGQSFVACAVAALAAIAFDRLIVVDETPDDEAEFRAAISVIADQMARQTRLYTKDGTQRPQDRSLR